MFKKHLLLVMCLGTYVAAMADGGYIVSYTTDNSNVATITESESSSSTLKEIITAIGTKNFQTGLKKVKIIGKVSDVEALSGINCATIDLSEADLPSIISGNFTNKNVKYVVLPNGMAKADVNTWAKNRFTNLESAASTDFVTEKQSKWVYDDDVIYEGERTEDNGTTAKGKINVDVPLAVRSSSYKNGDTDYTGTVLVGGDNKAYGVTSEANVVALTEHTGYIYSQYGAKSEYTGLTSVQDDGTIYGCINYSSTHTLKLNQTISYTYENEKYAYTGRVYDNGYAQKSFYVGGTEVELSKTETFPYYTYTDNGKQYIHEGPITTSDNNKYGYVGGTQLDLTEKEGYTLWNEIYEGVVSIEGDKAYGIYEQKTFQLMSIPDNSYYREGYIDDKWVKYLCDASTTGAMPVTDKQYYYLSKDGETKIVYETYMKVYYAQSDLETKSSPLGSGESAQELKTSTKYVYTIDGTEYTYKGKVYPDNKGYVGGTEYQLSESSEAVNYYTDENNNKIVYTGLVSDDNFGCIGYTNEVILTTKSPSIVVNYYEEDGKLVIYKGKVYGVNTAYVGGTEVTLTYETYYKDVDNNIFKGLRTADNKKGCTDSNALIELKASFEYAYTDPNTGNEETFTSEQVLTTKTVERIVELTLKEVDVATGKVALTAYVNTPGTLVYTLMNMSVFNNDDDWKSWANSQHGWYITGTGGYLYNLENVRDLILSGNLNAVDMNTGATCIDKTTMHYATSGELVSWNALPSCKPEKIDLSDALFVEGDDYHPEDMTISGLYTNTTKKGEEDVVIKEIILPTAESQNTIPDDFMNNCTEVESICIPHNYEYIGKRAFWNAASLSHIYTTDPRNTADPDNVKVDHGDGSFTFSANLKEIRSVGDVKWPTFFGSAMQTKVFDIYNLAVEAPKCGAYAFQGDLTCGSNGFEGNWAHPIRRENYINNGHVICILHYPTESKTYARKGGNCTEAENYEDITRVYTLADETGAVDGSGNTRAWPRHEEFWRSYNQAIKGYIWHDWKLYNDDNSKVVVSTYYEGVVEDNTKKYNQDDYQGWHEFVLTENNIFIPFNPQTTYNEFVEKDWYTICVPYNIRKSELLMALGVQANSKNTVKRLKKNADGTDDISTVKEDIYPDVRTLVQVKRSVRDRKVTLCLSDKLVTADKCLDVKIPDDRQGYTYTELEGTDPVVMKGGYPYLIRPFLPNDPNIKNIGAYVVAVAAQNGFTPSEYTGGIGETTAAGTKFSLPIREGVETQALNKDKSTVTPVYVTFDDNSPCMYNFVGTYLNGNVPQYGYYLGVNKTTKKHQFFRTTKTDTKWNPYSAIIKGFTTPEFTVPDGNTKETIENVRRTFKSDQPDDLIILASESQELKGKAMTLIMDDSGEDDNTTTAIRDIDTDRNKDNKVYTIGGMLTNGSGRLQKGIYIKNGKKHIVK